MVLFDFSRDEVDDMVKERKCVKRIVTKKAADILSHCAMETLLNEHAPGDHCNRLLQCQPVDCTPIPKWIVTIYEIMLRQKGTTSRTTNHGEKRANGAVGCSYGHIPDSASSFTTTARTEHQGDFTSR